MYVCMHVKRLSHNEKSHRNKFDRCEQAAPTEGDKVKKLLDILLRRDDRLMQSFCDLLRVTQQPHIVRILCRNGQQLTASGYNLLEPTYNVFSTCHMCRRSARSL